MHLNTLSKTGEIQRQRGVRQSIEENSVDAEHGVITALTRDFSKENRSQRTLK